MVSGRKAESIFGGPENELISSGGKIFRFEQEELVRGARTPRRSKERHRNSPGIIMGSEGGWKKEPTFAANHCTEKNGDTDSRETGWLVEFLGGDGG